MREKVFTRTATRLKSPTVAALDVRRGSRKGTKGAFAPLTTYVGY